MSSFGTGKSIALFLASVDDDCPTVDRAFPDACKNKGWVFNLLTDSCLRNLWTPRSGRANPARTNLFENIPIGFIGKNAVQNRVELDRFLQEVSRWFREEKRNNSIWLYSAFSGESGVKRSLVHSLEPTDFVVQYPTNNGRGIVIDSDLRVERHPVWEDVDRDTIEFDLEPIWGTTYDYSDLVSGTDPARIESLRFEDYITQVSAIPGTRVLNNVWIGVKQNLGCGLDNFDPLIELERSTATLTDTTIVADASASGGLSLRVDFATDTSRVKRVEISLADAFPGGDTFHEQWRGSYLVLLRAKTDVVNATRTSVTMSYGWRDNLNKIFARQSPVVIGNNSAFWGLYELGVVSFPQDSGKIASSRPTIDRLGSCSIDLYVGRDSGTGPIYLDSLYLIPFERMAQAIFNGDRFDPLAGGLSNWLSFFTNEDDTTEMRYYQTTAAGIFAGTNPVSDFEGAFRNLYLSETGGRIVVAAQGAIPSLPLGTPNDPGVFVHRLNYTTEIEMKTFNRWLSFKLD